jgi:hypothetical protein
VCRVGAGIPSRGSQYRLPVVGHSAKWGQNFTFIELTYDKLHGSASMLFAMDALQGGGCPCAFSAKMPYRGGGGCLCAHSLLRYFIPTLTPCCSLNRFQLYHYKLAPARCVPFNSFSPHLFGGGECRGLVLLTLYHI